MKKQRRPKGLSDIRRSAPPVSRPTLGLVRKYQQDAIDASVRKIRQETDSYKVAEPGTYPEQAGKTMTLDHTPDGSVLPPLGAEPEPYSILIGDKKYIAAEITEDIARTMTAEAASLQGKVLSDEQVEAMVKHLVGTGEFWKKHEQKARERAEAQTDPVKAHAYGVGYTGPTMPDKGKLDGSCNRSACQMPLKGKPQFWMKDYMVASGRLHYCAECAAKFDEADRQFGEPRRCTPVEG